MPRSPFALCCLLALSLAAAHADPPAESAPDVVLKLQPVEEHAPVSTPSEPAVPAEVPPVLPAPPEGLPALPAPPATTVPPLLLLPPQPPVAAPPSPVSPALRTVKAYYVGYAPESFEAVRRHAAAVDIVAGQWLAVDAEGQLRESPSHERNDEVRRIVRAAGNKVYTCVVNAGFSATVLSKTLNSRARRTAVINRIVAFVEKKGDDGVDLDFEGVRAPHRAAYTAFVKELAEKLHARGMELSLAVDASWDGTPSSGYDYRALSRYADSIMPMTYTFGPGAVPIAPIEYLEKAAARGVALMDPEKFMIGIGVYGRSVNLGNGRRATPGTSKIQALIAQHSAEAVLDAKTLTKKFHYTDKEGRHVLWFDDPETIQAKLARLYDKYGVASVGFWRMGQECPTLWDFIQLAATPQPDVTASVAGYRQMK